MAPSEERGPGNFEQYTWWFCWNGDQTEQKSHAYESYVDLNYFHIIVDTSRENLWKNTCYLTSIAGLIHVFDLDLMTQIFIFPCQTC